jgi:hypothetical protein
MEDMIMRQQVLPVYLIVIMGLLYACGQQGATEISPLLFQEVSQVEIEKGEAPEIIRARLVTVFFDLLGGDAVTESDFRPGSTLTLNLFEDAIYVAVLERIDIVSPGSLSWIGYLKDVEGSRVTLVVGDEVLVGDITFPGSMYRVRYTGDDIHEIQEIDPTTFPPEAVPLEEGS